MMFIDHASSCEMKSHESEEPLPFLLLSIGSADQRHRFPLGHQGQNNAALPRAGWRSHTMTLTTANQKTRVKSKENHYLDAGKALPVQTATQKHSARKIPLGLSSEDLNLMTWRLIFRV